MKKIWAMILLVGFFLAGCGAIQQQYNTGQLMENYIFNAPASKVYAVAESLFAEMKTPLHSSKQNEGMSDWVWQRHELGMSSYKERTRFTVTVTDVGQSQSKVRVFKESEPDKKTEKTLTSDMAQVSKVRQTVFEHLILKKLDPTAAEKIETSASNM